MLNIGDAPWHWGQLYAGQTLEFLPSDSKENFEKLCADPQNQKYFMEQGWLEPGAIRYQINSQGFRCKDFDLQARNIVCLGCSFTIGIGLPLESTWPQLVANELEVQTCTLAWGGSSADTCFRWAEYWLPILKPCGVFVLLPPPHRFELLTNNSDLPADVFLPGNHSYSNSGFNRYLKHWFSVDENSRLNSKKNKLAIQQLSNDLNMPCFAYDVFDFMANSREVVGWARDMMHAGPLAHRQLANKIIYDWSQKHA